MAFLVLRNKTAEHHRLPISQTVSEKRTHPAIFALSSVAILRRSFDACGVASMHRFLLTLLSTCTIVSFLSAEPLVKPGDDMWEILYQPPYSKPTELLVSDPLRKQLFDQLRLRTKEQVKFRGALKVFRNWALFHGKALDAEGKCPAGWEKDGGISALWIRGQDGWILVECDHFFWLWHAVYGVPKELIRVIDSRARNIPEREKVKSKKLAVGDPLRKELFNQLRTKWGRPERPVLFRGSLQVTGPWAVFTGDLLDHQGKELVFEGDENADTEALWIQTDSGWKLLEYRTGCYDTSLGLWSEKYGYP